MHPLERNQFKVFENYFNSHENENDTTDTFGNVFVFTSEYISDPYADE